MPSLSPHLSTAAPPPPPTPPLQITWDSTPLFGREVEWWLRDATAAFGQEVASGKEPLAAMVACNPHEYVLAAKAKGD